MSSLIIWLTNQTPRVFNNSPIQLFCNELKDYDYLIPIYYLDRSVFDGNFKLSGLPRFSELRKQYTKTFIKSFQEELRKLGSDLFISSIVPKELATQLNALVNSGDWSKVCFVYLEPDLYEENLWLSKIKDNLSQKIELICLGDTSSTNVDESRIYNDRFALWYSLAVPKYVKYTFVSNPVINQLLPKSVNISLDELYYEEYKEVSFCIPCTERESIEALKNFTTKLDEYESKRNLFSRNLTKTSTSLLEGALSSGILSRKLVYNTFDALPNSQAYIRQMSFYDHNLFLYRKYGAKTWFSREGINPSKFNKRTLDLDKFEQFRNAKTPTELINEPIKQLTGTGYVHNRLRMLLASYLCNGLRLDHRLGCELFEHYLLGFNPINNQAGWMWCGGVGNDNVPYPGRNFNIKNQYALFSLDKHVLI